MTRFLTTALALILVAALSTAQAQSLGTFRWQLQPFCNVITVAVVQTGATFTVDGFDDQCGAPQRAPLVGLATQNPDGTVGFGLHVVTVPGGRGLQIDARISLATLSGSWNDSAGNSGTFVLNTATGGATRPLPSAPAAGIPPVFALRADGAFLSLGTPNPGPITAEGAGTRMMWHPAKAAFRAGRVSGLEWNDFNVGVNSVAFGLGTFAAGASSTALGNATTAGGVNSTAMGRQTTTRGDASVAMGFLTNATGDFSTAMGQGTVADGVQSVATGLTSVASGAISTAMGDRTSAAGLGSTSMGRETNATGTASTAMGDSTTASGIASTAMGDSTTASGRGSTSLGASSIAGGFASMAVGVRAEALGNASIVLGSDARTTAAARGSFVFADQSTATTLVSAAPHEFTARAAGGVTFFTNAALSSGLRLAPGGSQWLGVSDVNTKHEFRAFDGETVLSKLARMPVMEWSYLAQADTVRHVGPTAQDFHTAFGLGEDPLRIGTMDADGVALAAVKALEARTSTLAADNRALRDALAAVLAELAELRARR